MNPEQARSIRTKKRLEDQLHFKEKDDLDMRDDEKDTKKIIRELEKQYKEESRELGKDDYDKMEYFGYRMEPFSMKEDREAGKIHDDGFVEINRTKGKETRDAWLDSLEEVEDPRFKGKREIVQEVEETAEPLDAQELFHLRKELYDFLTPGENANHILAKLRPAHANKTQTKHRKNIRKNVKTEGNSEQHNMLGKDGNKTNGTSDPKKEDTNKEETSHEEETQQEKDKKFARIVEICDLLIGSGYLDAFSDTKEDIQKKFMKEEDELIKHDLEDEGKIEDMNPDHNVIEE